MTRTSTRLLPGGNILGVTASLGANQGGDLGIPGVPVHAGDDVGSSAFG